MATITNYEGRIANLQDDYISKGHKEASANRPTSNSDKLDQNEDTLRSQAEKWVNNEIQLYNSILSNSSRTIQDSKQKTIELQTKIHQLIGENSLESSVEMDLASDRNDLIQATEKRMLAELDWKYFRANHGITAQAVYPDSHIYHIAIILVLAVFETIANAFFFENAQGLLGGFIVALGVSIVNMGAAILLGFGFRYKNLSTFKDQFVGWGCLVLFIWLSIYCNALFSSFRSQYQLLVDPSNAIAISEAFKVSAVEANKIFLLQMQFVDFMSFILFGFGMLLSIIAFYKGYTFDDKYPNYGNLDRLLKAIKKEEHEKKDAITAKIKDFLLRKRSEVQATIHEPAQLINLATMRSAELKAAYSNLVMQIKSIQLDFAMVLKSYRSANEAVRVTPAPAYFNETPDVSKKTEITPCDSLIQQLDEIQNDLTNLQNKYQTDLNKKLQQVQIESASLLTKLVPNFFSGVDKEAHHKINNSMNDFHKKFEA